MSHNVTRRTQAGAPVRPRVPPWLALLSGAVGSVLGIATNLYSAEFRSALEDIGNLNATLISVLVTAIVASGSTAIFYRWSIKRRQQTGITSGKMTIPSTVGAFADKTVDDRVVGRTLHYLEAKRDSPDLVVFLHGLGLDANDFRAYMAESRYHCLALTFYGFNDFEKDDERYTPISLESHIALLGFALDHLHHLHPKKRMTLVGFSFGADMILLLDEFTRKSKKLFDEVPIHRAVLLDPNIDQRTTTISSRIARVDQANPEKLLELLGSASTLDEFRYLCEYLYKILDKDFAQVQRHAREVVEKWDVDSPARFLDYLGRLIKLTGGVHVILSYNYEDLFSVVSRGADDRGLDANSLDCSQLDHFELIGAAFLKERLEGLL
ncbi:alpha/beta fold hydrolase [Actinoplanes sp. CA-054009]